MTIEAHRETQAGPGISSSLRALLTGVFDYAGLFPPARLGMAETVANYAKHLAGEHTWMLGRLVVPVARLDEFELAAASLLPHEDDPWQISGLTAPAGDTGLGADLDRIADFNSSHAGQDKGLAAIQVIELRVAGCDDIDVALGLLPDTVMPFFEIPADPDPRGLIAALAGTSSGAKIRTGGVEASAYPSPAQLARFIATCVTAEVPFKATAGLHHPLRHFSDAIGTDEFGFLNLLVASALARGLRLDETRLVEVLNESDPQAFTIEEARLGWRDLSLSADQIEDARLGYAAAIGSCSITEPIDDLRALGHLTKS